MTCTDQDFSFPAATIETIGSPPLWRPEKTTEACRETTRRSLSCAHARKKSVYERGEKIDFNVQIPRTRSYSRDDHHRNHKVDLGRCLNDNHKPVKWSGASSKNNSHNNSKNNSNSNNQQNRNQKPAMVVLKVLKKLFLTVHLNDHSHRKVVRNTPIW